MRLSFILPGLLGVYSLAAPTLMANPEPNLGALTTGNVVQRSADTEMADNARTFLIEFEKRADKNGGIRTLAG
jgi:hypothetical protein